MLSIINYLEGLGVKPYRIAQLNQAVYRDLIEDFSELTTFPQDLRDDLSSNCSLHPLKKVVEKTSSDGTVKVLLKTKDNLSLESVLMRHHKGRNTVCVSCQVGCAVGCRFCSTGDLGLSRNLTADEIVYQVIYFIKKLIKEDAKVTNIVFMGMGEPFHNYLEVIQAIEILNHPKKLAFGSRHITVSTSGIVSQIKKFIDHPLQVNLAVSLHAPNNKVRSQIMPINDTFDVEELISILDEYTSKTKRRIFYEYIMLKDVNDTVTCAQELGELLQGKLAHINLIPYNSGAKSLFQCSDKRQMLLFQEVLKKYGVPSTIRVSLGQDIDGACGQLANKT